MSQQNEIFVASDEEEFNQDNSGMEKSHQQSQKSRSYEQNNPLHTIQKNSILDEIDDENNDGEQNDQKNQVPNNNKPQQLLGEQVSQSKIQQQDEKKENDEKVEKKFIKQSGHIGLNMHGHEFFIILLMGNLMNQKINVKFHSELNILELKCEDIRILQDEVQKIQKNLDKYGLFLIFNEKVEKEFLNEIIDRAKYLSDKRQEAYYVITKEEYRNLYKRMEIIHPELRQRFITMRETFGYFVYFLCKKSKVDKFLEHFQLHVLNDELGDPIFSKEKRILQEEKLIQKLENNEQASIVIPSQKDYYCTDQHIILDKITEAENSQMDITQTMNQTQINQVLKQEQRGQNISQQNNQIIDQENEKSFEIQQQKKEESLKKCQILQQGEQNIEHKLNANIICDESQISQDQNIKNSGNIYQDDNFQESEKKSKKKKKNKKKNKSKEIEESREKENFNYENCNEQSNILDQSNSIIDDSQLRKFMDPKVKVKDFKNNQKQQQYQQQQEQLNDNYQRIIIMEDNFFDQDETFYQVGKGKKVIRCSQKDYQKQVKKQLELIEQQEKDRKAYEEYQKKKKLKQQFYKQQRLQQETNQLQQQQQLIQQQQQEQQQQQIQEQLQKQQKQLQQQLQQQQLQQQQNQDKKILEVQARQANKQTLEKLKQKQLQYKLEQEQIKRAKEFQENPDVQFTEIYSDNLDQSYPVIDPSHLQMSEKQQKKKYQQCQLKQKQQSYIQQQNKQSREGMTIQELAQLRKTQKNKQFKGLNTLDETQYVQNIDLGNPNHSQQNDRNNEKFYGNQNEDEYENDEDEEEEKYENNEEISKLNQEYKYTVRQPKINPVDQSFICNNLYISANKSKKSQKQYKIYQQQKQMLQQSGVQILEQSIDNDKSKEGQNSPNETQQSQNQSVSDYENNLVKDQLKQNMDNKILKRPNKYLKFKKEFNYKLKNNDVFDFIQFYEFFASKYNPQNENQQPVFKHKIDEDKKQLNLNIYMKSEDDFNSNNQTIQKLIYLFLYDVQCIELSRIEYLALQNLDGYKNQIEIILKNGGLYTDILKGELQNNQQINDVSSLYQELLKQNNKYRQTASGFQRYFLFYWCQFGFEDKIRVILQDNLIDNILRESKQINIPENISINQINLGNDFTEKILKQLKCNDELIDSSTVDSNGFKGGFGFNQPQQQQGGFNQPQQQQGGFNQPQQQLTRTQIICPGTLNEGESICSQNQQYWVKLNQDGNLNFYNNARQAPQDCLYCTNIDFSFNKAKHPVKLEMRNDGNVALIDSANFVYWETQTAQRGQAPYMITVLNEGDCVIYDSKNTTLWSFKEFSTRQKQQGGFNQPQQQGGFNQPQQQGGFNQPQQQMGFNQPQQQGGFNQPQQQGGFNQPQQQMGFNQPQQQMGFNQPQQQGGFNQPQQQGGFNQPQQQGGFNQPQQQGGFNQPQQQGGFNSAFDLPKQCKQCQKQGENPFYSEKLPMMVKRTKQVGNVLQGSACFDDFFGLDHQKEFHAPEISKITVYYTDRYIVGMESTFKATGKNLPGALNQSFKGFGVQSAVLEFGFATHIEEVSGSYDDFGLTSLKITTKKGSIDVGNKNIGTQFKNLLPFGIHTGVGFGGSFNNQAMQSIYLLYK